MNYWRALRSAVNEYGWRKTPGIAIKHLRRRLLTKFDLAFDLKHGIDTCAIRSKFDLDVDPDIKNDIVGYEPIPVKVLQQILRQLKIDHSRFTFVDFGSGKGRVLLLAANFPFRTIMGLELSAELHRIALKNLEAFDSASQACQNIQSLNINAVDFELPNEPLVLFFFTPFNATVLRPIMDRVVRFVNETLHDIYIIYYGSLHELLEQFARASLLHKEVPTTRSILVSEKLEAHMFYRAAGERSN